MVRFLFIFALSKEGQMKGKFLGQNVGGFFGQRGGEYLGQPKLGWCQVFSSAFHFPFARGPLILILIKLYYIWTIYIILYIIFTLIINYIYIISSII